jgi:transposase
MASAGLLANITVAKYQNALPLYRQENIFQEIGVDLPRQTMARWMVECAELVSPLVERMKEILLGSSVLHCDETVVQVLREKGKAPQTKSYMWVLASGKDSPPCYYFEYHPSRSQQAAKSLLNGFQGYLHVDGYSGYNAICSKKGVTRIGCFAHARRKFDETLKAGKSNKSSIASKALEKISELYEIERAIKESPPEVRNRTRQEKSKPLLNSLHEWASSVFPSVPLKSKLGKALRYLLDEWPNLVRFVDRPDLSIDNNRAENAVRPFVTGRKNWLFSSTPDGATASSRLYSLVTSAQANGHIPYLYLRDVYQEMAKLREKGSVQDLDHLLPWNWKITSEE